MPQNNRAPSDGLPSPSAIVAGLLAHRLIIVVGKGGVGKTTLSAALALRAAENGLDTVAAETDRRAPLAALFGRGPSLGPLEVNRRLAVVVLDGRRALEEYLRLTLPFGSLLDAIFSTKLYEHFVAAAPGLRELMMLGKVYYGMERCPQDERWETAVLDAPSTGQALGLLRMPFSARQTFSGGVVGREAENIGRLLQDPRSTCAALVSTPDHLSVKETLDNAAALKSLGVKIGAVILNRFRPATFNAGDLRQLMLRASRSRRLRYPEHISRLALAEIQRAAQSSHALNSLVNRINAPVLVIQVYDRLHGFALVKHLCASFDPDALEQEVFADTQAPRA
jgi:anion-transporting  ArsA/GET3 family ATPase